MRPLKRPMFRTGGPIKEGVMNGLKDGGPATYMADATMMAGGGMIRPGYDIGGKIKIPSGQGFGGALKGGLPDTKVAQQTQNISRTQKAIDAAKSLKNLNLERSAFGGIKNLFTGQSGIYKPIRAIAGQASRSFPFISSTVAPFAVVASGPKLISEMMRPKTYAALEYMKEMNQSGVMDETAGTEDFQAFGEKLNELNDTSKYTALPKRSLFSVLNPFSLTSGLKGGRKEAQAIVEKDKEKIKKAIELDKVPDAVSGTTKKTQAEKDAEKEALDKKKLDRIYSLLGVDRAKKNAASKALIDMSRYIDEQGKDAISKKNIGSTISKAISAFDRRLDKVDQLKEAAGLMRAKGLIEKDIRESDNELQELRKLEIKDKLKKDFSDLKLVSKIPGQKGVNIAAASASDNYRGNLITQSALSEAIEKIKKNEGILDETVIIENITNETIKDKNIADGDYTVGDALVTIEKGKVTAVLR